MWQQSQQLVKVKVLHFKFEYIFMDYWQSFLGIFVASSAIGVLCNKQSIQIITDALCW